MRKELFTVNTEDLPILRPPAFPGSYFLSFEGIEGAGKSTQIIKTREWLEKRGFNVHVLREPGGTAFGEKLRGAILDSHSPVSPIAEAYLFASSRAQLLEEVVLKELSRPGTIIILDRYIDSTLAYQGIGREIGMQTVLNIHKPFPLHLVPHLTFYLRIDPELSERRQKVRNAPKDYFERKGTDFYKKLVAGYDHAAELFSNRIVTLDGSLDAAKVTDNLLDKLESWLNEQSKQERGESEEEGA